jgi:hypothetical protein
MKGLTGHWEEYRLMTSEQSQKKHFRNIGLTGGVLKFGVRHKYCTFLIINLFKW